MDVYRSLDTYIWGPAPASCQMRRLRWSPEWHKAIKSKGKKHLDMIIVASAAAVAHVM